jgi:two-component system OmpR family response regulator
MFHLPVLLVDDEPQVRSLIRAILSKQGFQILEAADGERALSTVEALHGEIAIMIGDYSMPGLTGGTLAKLVRGQFPAIPILLVSSAASACDCLSGDAFLAKPFIPSDLVDAVRCLLPQESLECA